MMLPRSLFAVGVLFALCVMLSLVHPWGNPRAGDEADKPLLAGSAVPIEVMRTIDGKCADCHSAKTHWPWYGRVAPGSWLMERDVITGRSELNLSLWERYTREQQMDLLTKIASEARSGQMPLKPYLMLHPRAKLTAEEQQMLYDWAKAERRRIRQQGTAEPGGTH